MAIYLYMAAAGKSHSTNHEEQNPNNILFISYAAQGHINPIFQLAKLLCSTSLTFNVTFITSESGTKSILKSLKNPPSKLKFESFSTNPKFIGKDASDIISTLKSMELTTTEFLSEAFRRLSPSCVVYDSVMPFVLDIAKPLGITCVSFLTQPCCVNAMFYMRLHGMMDDEVEKGLPAAAERLGVWDLAVEDLPSFLQPGNPYMALSKFVSDQFSNVSEADWVLCNTFDELEQGVLAWLRAYMPVATIGPLLPAGIFDDKFEESYSYDTDLYEKDEDCMKWLEDKEDGSIVYVAFGSLAEIGDEQMAELAWGLKKSKKKFLWVVKTADTKEGKNNLPDMFVEEITKGDLGLVVSWCSQLEVLRHRAIGCFVSHCGWNSTIEALSLGVPVVAMPQWTDQPLNSKFIDDVWKFGVRTRKDEKGLVSREEILRCLKLVMEEGEKKNEVRENAAKMKEMATRAVLFGGSSYNNLKVFTDGIKR